VGHIAPVDLVGQALFIPSPCEGLPVHFCRGEIVSDRKEYLYYRFERRVVMLRFVVRAFAILAAVLPLGRGASCNAAGGSVTIPNPSVDAPLAPTKSQQTAVLAGGCFWGIQAVFEHLKGVIRATSGYSGGSADTAQYERVSTGRTGHAEAVQVTYDPSQITYGQLLKVFFSVAHDPTQLNQQGPDVGTQYRSAIFYASEEQKRIAQAYVNQLNQAKVFPRAIATQIVTLNAFYPAEDYHQDYADNHPENLYIVINDLPKVEHLHKQFPELYVEKK
jgi:peptide-methionine (S)-S-oxide reductase